jgi:ATP-dependent RNA helicase RhlE
MIKEADISNNNTFNNLGLNPKILDILTKAKFVTPTPIQKQAIPEAVAGKDLIGIAQTGTGKTLAFGLPMIQRLGQNKGQGLVILPTRELALQVDEALKNIGKNLGLKTAVLIGGQSMGIQLRDLRRSPHIIVATPGRLIDHLEQGTIKLDLVNMLVLDEADRMLDMGFAPQIKKILQTVPKDRQTMLFSATMPDSIVGIATSYMKLPVRVEVAPAGTSAQQVAQEVFFVHKNDKLSLLQKLLTDYSGSILVFSRTKFGAKKITKSIFGMGHSAAEIHSNRSLPQRREALEGFKKGRYRVLVATDIAARGIDVTGIELVINFDLPDSNEDYVHRIGRTGRAGLTGRAISFATPEQRGDVKAIERLIRKVLTVLPLPSNLPKRMAEAVVERGPRPPQRPNRFGAPSSRPFSSQRSYGGSSPQKRDYSKPRFDALSKPHSSRPEGRSRARKPAKPYAPSSEPRPSYVQRKNPTPYRLTDESQF